MNGDECRCPDCIAPRLAWLGQSETDRLEEENRLAFLGSRAPKTNPAAAPERDGGLSTNSEVTR